MLSMDGHTGPKIFLYFSYTFKISQMGKKKLICKQTRRYCKYYLPHGQNRPWLQYRVPLELWP